MVKVLPDPVCRFRQDRTIDTKHQKGPNRRGKQATWKHHHLAISKYGAIESFEKLVAHWLPDLLEDLKLMSISRLAYGAGAATSSCGACSAKMPSKAKL